MMIMAEMAAFDNLEELIEMTEDLTTFVREAVVDCTFERDRLGSRA